MPILYLSPSTQEGNPYITGSGSEERQMNLLADEMEPYLRSSGIQFRRNHPDMTASSSAREANAGYYDLYLALHSNASGDGSSEGPNRGIIAFYYPSSIRGKRAAELFAENLRQIYPLPQRVTAQPAANLGELRLPRFPAVLLEIGYHDNFADARWIEENTPAIARNLVQSLAEFFDIPFIEAMPPREGRVDVQYGTLNLRRRPDSGSTVIANLPAGAEITVWGQWQGWYVVEFQGLVGYAAAAYIRV